MRKFGSLPFTVLTLTAAVLLFCNLSAGQAANLDQCRNGAFGSEVACTGSAWVNGNAGASNAHYVEGDSISYRMRMTGLTSGTAYDLFIQWDTTKSSKHALDYITTWNRTTLPGSDACSDVSGAVCGSPTSYSIPLSSDPAVPAALPLTTPVSENFTMYGGTISQVRYQYTSSFSWGGDTSQGMVIRFTAANSVVVLAWGGHIAKRQEWYKVTNPPFTGTASNISGSPYHMRLKGFQLASGVALTSSSYVLPTTGGNQDRSLSAAAVISPSSITVTKLAPLDPSAAFTFNFTTQPSGSSLSFPNPLKDQQSQVFSNITIFGSYGIAELVPTGWSLASRNCVVQAGGLSPAPTINNSSPTNGVTVGLTEGNDVVCTFTDNPIGKDLTASKTAVPAFTRTYSWSIAKAVDKTSVTGPVGGSATFNYTVTVKETSFSDGAYALSGKITISNPNPFTFTVGSVTDAVDNGGACSVTSGTNFTIPANDSVTKDYSCTYSSTPTSKSGTNTATISWTPSSNYNTPSSSATATKTFTFSTPTTTVNKTVNVNDTWNGTTTALGTATAVDSTPYTSTEFKYAHTVTIPSGCYTYNNTAKIVETNQTANASVTVCGFTGAVVPTNTSCGMYASKTYSLLNYVFYSPSNTYPTKIGTTNPGVFFYYTTVKVTTAGTYTFGISQTNNAGGGWPYEFLVQQNNQIYLYNAACSVLAQGTGTSTGQASLTKYVTAGTYYIGVKYSTNSLVGAPLPPINPVTFSYRTYLGTTLVDGNNNGLFFTRQ